MPDIAHDCEIPGCVAHFGDDDRCPRCDHELRMHGYGCTVGWFSSDDECHCPNNAIAQVAESCCLVKCEGGTVTHVDSMGQFYCAEHADEEGRVYRLRPIDEVTQWQNEVSAGAGSGAGSTQDGDDDE